MAEQLSGVTVVIFIGGGVLTFFLLFLFAKRQIMRFALRSRRGPYVPIGHDTKKAVRKEIERRIELIPKITYEPKLIRDSRANQQSLPAHYYKMKALDSSKLLEQEIADHDAGLVRHSNEPLRSFLINFVFGGLLTGKDQKIIHEYCDLYELARFDPQEFGSEEYESFFKLQGKLMEIVRTSQYFGAGKKTSPCRTPVKKAKKKKCGSPKTSREGQREDDEAALCVDDHMQKDADVDSKHETTV